MHSLARAPNCAPASSPEFNFRVYFIVRSVRTGVISRPAETAAEHRERAGRNRREGFAEMASDRGIVKVAKHETALSNAQLAVTLS